MLAILLLLLSLSNAELKGFDIESQFVENIPNFNTNDVTNEEKDNPQLPDTDLDPIRSDLNIQNGALEVSYRNVSSSSSNEEEMGKNALLANPDFSILMQNMTTAGLSSLKDKVTQLAKYGSVLRNDTDTLSSQLNLLYINLAIDDGENEESIENSYKYGMSVILRFLFEFYRIFRKLSTQAAQSELALDVDVYSTAYDNAVVALKDKKNYTPLQLSATVKRSVDIFKSILYESAAIIQTKCSSTEPNWKCIIVYLATLVSESANCSNIWYHAVVHMLAVLKVGVKDSFVYKIANLEVFQELAHFENIFDFVVDKIQQYKDVGKDQLSLEGVFFTMVADLQDSGLLDCIAIDDLYI